MIPAPKVQRVATCRICHDKQDLIVSGTTVVCRLCVRIQTRLAVVTRPDRR